MTNYGAWDTKAASLLREADEDDKQQKEDADKALGLEGGPKGPPTAKAESEMKDLGKHSDLRKEFINWSKGREVSVTHPKQDDPIVLEGEEVKDKAVRISASEDVTYIIPEGSGVVKLNFDKCKRVRVQILGSIITSTVEVCRCVDLSFELAVPIGTFQVDECTSPVLVNFAERDHVGRLYHHNSPGLSVGFGGAGAKLDVVGRSGEVQHFTRLGATGTEPFVTDVVRRGEGEFPVDLEGDRKVAEAAGGYPNSNANYEQPEPETPPLSEENKRKAQMKRESGNNMFRANDFLQAAMEYTSALELDPTMSPLYANRSQCWLKVGNHEKALEDAVKCTEVDPTNSKGWFRKGMSLHAMKKFPEAIPALLEAEKLEPNNKQIPDAIKMAQLMARKQASS